MSEELGWANLVRVKSDWIDRRLLQHGSFSQAKITTRAYSIRFASTREHMDGLVNFMVNSIEHYVLSDSEIENCKKKEISAWLEASTLAFPASYQQLVLVFFS